MALARSHGIRLGLVTFISLMSRSPVNEFAAPASDVTATTFDDEAQRLVSK